MRESFFGHVRRNLFKGGISQEQVEGIEKVLDYWQAKWPKMPIAELAYVLATIYHETNKQMKPVMEAYYLPYDARMRYLRSKVYWPWYGRGLVQITWIANYKKFGLSNPEQALEWDHALDITFRGMVLGMFTRFKLSDFITEQKVDFIHARQIINGMDKAEEIAEVAKTFLTALLLLEEMKHVPARS